MKVVIAEKPSVARELASFLGASARRDGYFEGNGYQVTWALGHLVTLMEPHDYDPALKKWSLETLPFVPERFGLKPIAEPRSRKQLAVVRRLFRSADREQSHPAVRSAQRLRALSQQPGCARR